MAITQSKDIVFEPYGGYGDVPSARPFNVGTTITGDASGGAITLNYQLNPSSRTISQYVVITECKVFAVANSSAGDSYLRLDGGDWVSAPAGTNVYPAASVMQDIAGSGWNDLVGRDRPVYLGEWQTGTDATLVHIVQTNSDTVSYEFWISGYIADFPITAVGMTA